MSAQKWWHDLTELNNVAAWLFERDELITAKDVLAYYVRPWRWEKSREEMLSVRSGDLFVCSDCDCIERPVAEDQTLCVDCYDRRHHDAVMLAGSDK